MEFPKYEATRSDSEDDDSDTNSAVSSNFISRETTLKTDIEDYESDDDVVRDSTSILGTGTSFKPVLNNNVFNVPGCDHSIYIGLKEKQTLFVAGIFDIQIVKGGIIYNNNHYNASNKQILNMWHPMSSSVPAIVSSFYAGWKEPILQKSKLAVMPTLDPEQFTCIIKVSNNKNFNGITEGYKLLSDFNFFWIPRNSGGHQFVNEESTFTLLDEQKDIFTPLEIPHQWTQMLENLQLQHNNSDLDTRIMIIGGKNSGKSTILRLLIEKMSNQEQSQENNNIDSNTNNPLWYLDLDPGQPEYSDPECVSLGHIDYNTNVKPLGTTFGQCGFNKLRQHFLGVNSPQENPELYLSLIDDLFEYFEDQYFTGTSLLNLPGWIKGFGINIINHVIAKYKPTHIIMLEYANRLNFEEVFIPQNFTSNLRENYAPSIIRLSPHKSSSTNDDVYNQLKFQASQLRTFRTLLLFHKQFDKNNHTYNFDFKPLLATTPLQVSIGGKNCINGIYLMEEFQNLHKNDIKGVLEGCIVGIHKYVKNPDDDNNKELENIIEQHGIYPLVKGRRAPKDFQYFTLGLIHSINEADNLVNVYVPDVAVETLSNPKQTSQWVLVRGKTETPMCELYPPKRVISEYINMNDQPIPYISTQRAKKHEHVWKVRKNIQRRGHFMK